eukprot:scaffold18106_cov40-Tisochrysis_lutea.AAC.1
MGTAAPMFCGGVVVLQAFDAGLVAEDGGDLHERGKHGDTLVRMLSVRMGESMSCTWRNSMCCHKNPPWLRLVQ